MKRYLTKFAVASGRRWGAVALAAAVLGSAGCASLPGGGSLSGDTPAEAKAAAVSKRALDRWDLLIKGDTKAAYAYLSPASREVTSLERFQAKTNTAAFRAIKLDNVSCEAESCRVRLFLTIDHRQMTGLTVPLEETWVIADGQAWYVYRE